MYYLFIVHKNRFPHSLVQLLDNCVAYLLIEVFRPPVVHLFIVTIHTANNRHIWGGNISTPVYVTQHKG